MKKLKALVTADINRAMLEEELANVVEFVYDGYFVDHDVMPHKKLVSMISEYDILICEYDTVSADVFDAAEKLKLIICCRGGVKTVVNLDKAMERGVIVCNNAGRNAGAVTDMVMGYLLDLTRNITLANNLIHSRSITSNVSTKPAEYSDTVWGLDNNSPFIKYRGNSLNHMTLGIVGYGRAGRRLAEKAHVFGMEILAYDPYSEFEDKPEYVHITVWDELLAKSDAISVHCILSAQTRNMFNKSVFGKMKNGSYFINTSRGEILVEEDLVDALKNGKLAGAALDVTREEPISSDSVLLNAPNLLITPHIAGSANDVQYCGTRMVIESLNSFLEGKKPHNCVIYR